MSADDHSIFEGSETKNFGAVFGVVFKQMPFLSFSESVLQEEQAAGEKGAVQPPLQFGWHVFHSSCPENTILRPNLDPTTSRLESLKLNPRALMDSTTS